jgi:uncharacterized protein (TIGR02217 family)
VFKTPTFKTITQISASGKEVRAALWMNPQWKFKFNWDVLKDSGAAPTAFDTMVDFFLSRQGSYDSFLYTDPSDNAVTNQNFGTGDGTTVAFQLVRQLVSGGFNEVIQNLNGAPVIKDNGVTKTAGSDYSINSTGLVTFAVAPVTGHALTWTGNFYYRLRFLNDLQEFEEFYYQYWNAKSVEMLSVKS